MWMSREPMNETFLIIDGALLRLPICDWTGLTGAHSCPITFHQESFDERWVDEQPAANGWLFCFTERPLHMHAYTHTSPCLSFTNPPAIRFHGMGNVILFYFIFKIRSSFTACSINSMVYSAPLLTWQNWSWPAEPQRQEKIITLQFCSRFVVLSQQIFTETVSKYANRSQRVEFRFAGITNLLWWSWEYFQSLYTEITCS